MEALTQDRQISRSWPANPYKGLSYYGPGDVSLFAGREEDVKRCARRLADHDIRVLVLQGGTGCGKSSFLRAGLIPYLETHGFDFEFLKDPTTSVRALFVRCTDQPLSKLSEALYDFVTSSQCIQTPRGPRQLDLSAALLGTPDREAFMEDAGTGAARMVNALQEVASRYPRTLVLVIDQAEEILTLTKGEGGKEARDRFFEFVSLFSRERFDLKLVLAIRSEYFGKFYNEFGVHNSNRDATTDFLLDDLTRQEITAAILRPTEKHLPQEIVGDAGQPYESYAFSYDQNLAGRIADDLLNAPQAGGVLPVMQIVCDRLYRRGKQRSRPGEKWAISSEDYVTLGGLQGQIDAYLNEVLETFCIQELGEKNRWKIDREIRKWMDLLTELAGLQYDGTATTKLVRIQDLAKRARALQCEVDFEKMMSYLQDDEQRILRPPVWVTDRGTRQTYDYFSLGHDAIALSLNRWRESHSQSRADRVRSAISVGIKAWAILGMFTFGMALLGSLLGFFDDDLQMDTAMAATVLGVFGSTFAFSVFLFRKAKRIGEWVVELLEGNRFLSRLLGFVGKSTRILHLDHTDQKKP